MPKSDTWPGGVGLETMTGMDSAGSCDSVLSANSVFSDDSMEHLSAEEKACLMFLEETIESLDTEEDSGLSNDEPDQLPIPGNLANKMADLSASLSKIKLAGSQKPASEEPEQDSKPMQSYLVPTPLVVASGAPCSALNAKPAVPPDRYKPRFTPPSSKPDRDHNPVAPHVPLEVNVVIPPPTRPRDYSGRKAEGLPRGPLSYEALVHLRRSASTKKTPLCPTIDHTIELDRRLPVTVEGQNLEVPPRSDRSHSEAYRSKVGPPVVGPKPKRIPGSVPVKAHHEASATSDSVQPFDIKNASDAHVVRLEALQKLGLLAEREPEGESAAPPPPPPPPRSSLDPTPNRFARAPPHVTASRSPSFCQPAAPAEPKGRPLQSSASFHHCSRGGQPPAPDPPRANGPKATGLERSATLDNHRTGGSGPPGAPRRPSNAVGYTVMVVPGMGADRKEALRKLGLLKD